MNDIAVQNNSTILMCVTIGTYICVWVCVCSFQVCLAEAERKYEQAIESSTQLDNEKSDLMSQVNTLQDRVQQLEEELSETHRNCDEIKRVSTKPWIKQFL